MGARENLQRLIDRKKQEARELEASLRDTQVYIDALMDAMKTLPKEGAPGSNGASGVTLRPGTMVDRVRQLLRDRGKPLHITEILSALGRPLDKNNRVSVSGSLAAYVRNKQIFTRPKPNTFGLIEMDLASQGPAAKDENTVDEEFPESFGQ